MQNKSKSTKITPKSFRKKSDCLRNARKLKKSSQQWMQRQINDPYVQQAKLMNLRSRSAFKLLQIQEKHQIIKKKDIVIDLGAAPGGWSQIAAQILKPKTQIKNPTNNTSPQDPTAEHSKKNQHPRIFAIDLLPIEPIDNVWMYQGNFNADATVQALVQAVFEATNSKLANVIISDMAPNTSGHKQTDHLRIMDLSEQVLDFAINHLHENGNLVTKIFHGGIAKDFSIKLKKYFRIVGSYKPPASRKESTETYLIAKSFKKQRI